MMENLNWGEIGGGIIALLSTLSAIGYGAKKKGLITFGKPVERRQNPCGAAIVPVQCADHPKLMEKVDAMNTKLDSVHHDVGVIAGYLQGKNGKKVI